MLQNLLSMTRACVDYYSMINEGDKIAVGVSGGKDSVSLLYLMSELRRFYPKHFELYALSLEMGFPDMDFKKISELCKGLGITYIMESVPIREVVFDIKREKNPCSLCAKMRRGALNSLAVRHGIRKVALGHHFDDAVETFMLSLMFEGRLSCFQPVTWLDRMEVTQIRPMLYIHEKRIEGFVKRYELPVVHNTCPADKRTKREDAKKLLFELEGRYPGFKENIFGALRRSDIKGWKDSSAEE